MIGMLSLDVCLMPIQLTVSSIVCDGCAEAIANAIKNQIPDAQVTVNLPTKLVTVETNASEAQIRHAIAEAGHEVV